MKSFWKRLTSRKFIASMIGTIIGLAAVFGLDGGTISDVAGIITAAASLIAYIVAEGKIDAAAVESAIYALVDDSESEAENE